MNAARFSFDPLSAIRAERRSFSPLVEELRGAMLPVLDMARFVVPDLGPAVSIGERPFLLLRDDAASLAGYREASTSLAQAAVAGVQIPRDLFEGLVARRVIGKVRHELAVTENAFVVTRFVDPVREYDLLVLAARAGDFPGWVVVDGRRDGVHGVGHHWPILSPVDVSTPTVAEAGAKSIRSGGRQPA